MKIELEFTVNKQIDTGPPIGPAVFSYGLDVNKVVSEIKEKIKNYDFDVDIIIEIDLKNRDFSVKLKKPKTTDFIKKLSKDNTITKKNIKLIAQTLNKSEKEIEGTCKSMHIKIK